MRTLKTSTIITCCSSISAGRNYKDKRPRTQPDMVEGRRRKRSQSRHELDGEYTSYIYIYEDLMNIRPIYARIILFLFIIVEQRGK